MNYTLEQFAATLQKFVPDIMSDLAFLETCCDEAIMQLDAAVCFEPHQADIVFDEEGYAKLPADYRRFIDFGDGRIGYMPMMYHIEEGSEYIQMDNPPYGKSVLTYWRMPVNKDGMPLYKESAIPALKAYALSQYKLADAMSSPLKNRAALGHMRMMEDDFKQKGYAANADAKKAKSHVSRQLKGVKRSVHDQRKR